LPPPVAGPIGALALEGDLGGRVHLAFDLDAAAGDGVQLDVDLANRCRALADPPEADVVALAGVADHGFPDGSRAPVGPGVGDWTSMISLPGHVDGAFVAAEDARFFVHHGFDVTQIARSLEIDLREGRFARGGSTISQQLVKNAFLSQRRTLDRKLQEAVLTWRLEQALSKRQILERYLNVVELGPGVYGVAAAARHWFGKPPQDLTVVEAAFLAAITPEPRSASRRIAAAGGLDPDTAQRVTTVLRHMQRAGVISDRQRADARVERLSFRADALAPRPTQISRR
ncbi:MAG: transglycosylase domain-containing protein, partial [Myxococcales bacterium]|nr:transglycosylase domain-containing protein [Myxococcales bacterium]